MACESSSGSGVGFLGLLGLLFIGLKLGGVITWSWWYVTLPLWGPITLVIAVLVIMALIAGVSAIGAAIINR